MTNVCTTGFTISSKAKINDFFEVLFFTSPSGVGTSPIKKFKKIVDFLAPLGQTVQLY